MLGAIPRFALLLPVLFSNACSYAFVHGPPAPPAGLEEQRMAEQSVPECTSSNAVPVLDSIVAVPLLGVGVLLFGYGAGGGCGRDCIAPSSGVDIALGAALTGLGVLALSSAISGYGRTADCRRAQESGPTGPRPTQRHLLDVPAIARARAEDGP